MKRNDDLCLAASELDFGDYDYARLYHGKVYPNFLTDEVADEGEMIEYRHRPRRTRETVRNIHPWRKAAQK